MTSSDVLDQVLGSLDEADTSPAANISIPGPTLIIDARPEPVYLVRERDFDRVVRRLRKLPPSMGWVGAAAWASLGLTGSGVYAYIAEAARGPSLNAASQSNVPLDQVLLVVTIMLGIVTAVLFILHGLMRRQSTAHLADVIDDLESLRPPHPRAERGRS